MPPSQNGLNPLVVMTNTTFGRNIVDPTCPCAIPIPVLRPFYKKQYIHLLKRRKCQHVSLHVIDDGMYMVNTIEFTTCPGPMHAIKKRHPKRTRYRSPMTPGNDPNAMVQHEIAKSLDFRRIFFNRYKRRLVQRVDTIIVRNLVDYCTRKLHHPFRTSMQFQ